MSCRRACRIVKVSRSVYRYKARPREDEQVIAELDELAGKHPGYGFWKMHGCLRMKGRMWNHKRTYRVYTEMKLNLRRKRKRRLPVRERVAIAIPVAEDRMWSMDFMSDALHNGKKVRVLNIIDDYNREALAMEVDTSLPAPRVTNTLERLLTERGKPMAIRTDNGPEFISNHVMDWCHRHRIQLQFIQPGKPMQNSLIERFNGSYRKEVLDAYVFYSMAELREVTRNWMNEYNTQRPHDSLGGMSPLAYVLKYGKRSAGHNADPRVYHNFNTSNDNNEESFLFKTLT